MQGPIKSLAKRTFKCEIVHNYLNAGSGSSKYMTCGVLSASRSFPPSVCLFILMNERTPLP